MCSSKILYTEYPHRKFFAKIGLPRPNLVPHPDHFWLVIIGPAGPIKPAKCGPGGGPNLTEGDHFWHDRPRLIGSPVHNRVSLIQCNSDPKD